VSRLDRFRHAQDSLHAGFATALAEVRAGEKRGHWIWYVFPQIGGLGTSAAAQAYAIDGTQEAVEYLRDPELSSRLLTAADAVGEQLRAGKPLRELMGSDTDAKKLVSSMTLFGHVARRLRSAGDADAFGSIAGAADDILTMAATQGYPPCAYTLRRLREADGAVWK